MPLRAILDQQELLAPLLSEEEWEELKYKKIKITLPCCKARGYLRTSKRGIKHFVHQKKSECISGGETWQHLLCKTEIVRACKDMGYDVKTEVSGIDWRTDVLATKQGKSKLIKLAFEVQWSLQSLEETQKRQEKYIRDGIRCCWLFKNLPINKPRKDIPMFNLKLDKYETPIVIINEKINFKLYDFITELTSSNFKFCQLYRYKKQQKIKIRFFPIYCWKCNKRHYIYHVKNQSYLSICNQKNFEPSQFYPEIIKKAYECLKTETAQAKNMTMGQIKSRYSRTVGEKYTSFGCPFCDAIFGEHFYFEEICNVEYGYVESIDFETTVNITLEDIDGSHWCYSPAHNFCCNSNF